VDPGERVRRLQHGHAQARTISPHYDEVFRDVQARVADSGSIGKSDIAALTCWKRLRADTPWVMALLEWSDADVRDITRPAVLVVRNGDVAESAGKAREMLRPLPGFGRGTALASAVLTAAAPLRLAVFDKNARLGLGQIGLELPVNASSFYAKYMTLIEQCRSEAADAGHEWLAREVDLALYMLGKQRT
jgi:hypothetical protein